jgi:ribulose-phosphate 3-epimerase
MKTPARVLIAPSILSADFAILGQQIAKAEQGGADWIHLDVMDGHFVPNLTIGPPVVRSLRKLTRLPFDVHLMVTNPDDHLQAFSEAGADRMTVHVETCPHLQRTVQHIHALGAKAGVCINPATPPVMLEQILPDTELVLIMTVNPGFGGQSFLPGSVEKIRTVRRMIHDRRLSTYVEVDGGIEPATASSVVEAGADVLVAGHFIFTASDVAQAVRTLRQSAYPSISA